MEHKASLKILSLDGGGVHALSYLPVLGELEAQVQGTLLDSHVFSHLSGTSTGSIAALGIALGLSVEEIIELYVEHSPEIFTKSAWQQRIFHKYTSKHLRRILNQLCEERIGTENPTWNELAEFIENQNGPTLIITLWNLTEGRSAFVSTAREVPNQESHLFTARAADVIAASCSAPYYFPPILFPNEAKEESVYCDGGISGFNNPTLLALKFVFDSSARIHGEIDILSLSSGESSSIVSVDSLKRWSALDAGLHSIDSLMRSTATFMDGFYQTFGSRVGIGVYLRTQHQRDPSSKLDDYSRNEDLLKMFRDERLDARIFANGELRNVKPFGPQQAAGVLAGFIVRRAEPFQIETLSKPSPEHDRPIPAPSLPWANELQANWRSRPILAFSLAAIAFSIVFGIVSFIQIAIANMRILEAQQQLQLAGLDAKGIAAQQLAIQGENPAIGLKVSLYEPDDEIDIPGVNNNLWFGRLGGLGLANVTAIPVGGTYRKARLSPAGTKIFCETKEKLLKLISLEDGSTEFLHRISQDQIRRVDFSQDGKFVLVKHSNSTFTLYDLAKKTAVPGISSDAEGSERSNMLVGVSLPAEEVIYERIQAKGVVELLRIPKSGETIVKVLNHNGRTFHIVSDHFEIDLYLIETDNNGIQFPTRLRKYRARDFGIRWIHDSIIKDSTLWVAGKAENDHEAAVVGIRFDETASEFSTEVSDPIKLIPTTNEHLAEAHFLSPDNLVTRTRNGITIFDLKNPSAPYPSHRSYKDGTLALTTDAKKGVFGVTFKDADSEFVDTYRLDGRTLVNTGRLKVGVASRKRFSVDYEPSNGSLLALSNSGELRAIGPRTAIFSAPPTISKNPIAWGEHDATEIEFLSNDPQWVRVKKGRSSSMIKKIGASESHGKDENSILLDVRSGFFLSARTFSGIDPHYMISLSNESGRIFFQTEPIYKKPKSASVAPTGDAFVVDSDSELILFSKDQEKNDFTTRSLGQRNSYKLMNSTWTTNGRRLAIPRQHRGIPASRVVDVFSIDKPYDDSTINVSMRTDFLRFVRSDSSLLISSFGDDGWPWSGRTQIFSLRGEIILDLTLTEHSGNPPSNVIVNRTGSHCIQLVGSVAQAHVWDLTSNRLLYRIHGAEQIYFTGDDRHFWVLETNSSREHFMVLRTLLDGRTVFRYRRDWTSYTSPMHMIRFLPGVALTEDTLFFDGNFFRSLRKDSVELRSDVSRVFRRLDRLSSIK